MANRSLSPSSCTASLIIGYAMRGADISQRHCRAIALSLNYGKWSTHETEKEDGEGR
tara:strand:+ start:186 stop:356 length:171 start_codon:yes stop_codon:yes gene_type:complete